MHAHNPLSHTTTTAIEERRKSRSTLKVPTYGIEMHKHRFAAWAAGRAASVKNCRFSVEQAKEILEASGFDASFSDPKWLPEPSRTDQVHKDWRTGVIKLAAVKRIEMTHGVAAKLINCYLKSRFVCGGHHDHPKVRHIHPPIDEVLLKTLAQADIGGQRVAWSVARSKRWSKFNSDDYEAIINAIKLLMGAEPLWMIEEHWRGYQ